MSIQTENDFANDAISDIIFSYKIDFFQLDSNKHGTITIENKTIIEAMCTLSRIHGRVHINEIIVTNQTNLY